MSKAIEKTREAAKSDDLDRIKSAVHELEQASHALSKTLYEKAGARPARRGPRPAPAQVRNPAPRPPSGGDDDAIDAEFEVKE